MDYKAFISQLEIFKIHSSVVDDDFRLPLTSPADSFFLRGHTKQKTGIINAHSITDAIDLEACLWRRHSVD